MNLGDFCIRTYMYPCIQIPKETRIQLVYLTPDMQQQPKVPAGTAAMRSSVIELIDQK